MSTPDPLHFERLGAAYDRARPPYPAALWSRLDALGLLRQGARALDLGAGSGQATGPLVAAGLHVSAVEPGPSLADELASRFPGVTVIRSVAEELDLAPRSFDLVVAATSLHWMDPAIVLPTVHAALAARGRIAAWWTEFGDAAVRTPFRDAVAGIVAGRPEPSADPRRRWTVPRWTEVMTAEGRFALEWSETFRWSIVLDTDRVRALFTTFSEWSEAEVARAAEAVDELGGSVEEHYRTPLIVCSRS